MRMGRTGRIETFARTNGRMARGLFRLLPECWNITRCRCSGLASFRGCCCCRTRLRITASYLIDCVTKFTHSIYSRNRLPPINEHELNRSRVFVYLLIQFCLDIGLHFQCDVHLSLAILSCPVQCENAKFIVSTFSVPLEPEFYLDA